MGKFILYVVVSFLAFVGFVGLANDQGWNWITKVILEINNVKITWGYVCLAGIFAVLYWPFYGKGK